MNIKPISSILSISFFALMSTGTFAHEQHSYPNGCEHSASSEHGAYFEKRMSALHTALKLTAAQEAGWTEFSGKMKPAEMAKHEDWAKLSTPDRLDHMLEGMKLHEQSMIEHVAAVKTFYTTLTAEQKATFDSNFTGRYPMGHHHGVHHHPMGHHHGVHHQPDAQ